VINLTLFLGFSINQSADGHLYYLGCYEVFLDSILDCVENSVVERGLALTLVFIRRLEAPEVMAAGIRRFTQRLSCKVIVVMSPS
jgi:hypothetical protein